MRITQILVACAGLFLLAGCAARNINPSFPVSQDFADAEIQRFIAQRVPAKRPIVILGGYGDEGIGVRIAAIQISKWFSKGTIIGICTTDDDDFEAARAHVIRAVMNRLPSKDPMETVEVDVIGQSMGGLLSRFCAAPLAGRPRLKAKHIFTISSPHDGAMQADMVRVPDRMAVDMRSGSPFTKWVCDYDALRDYELICYARLHDKIVGPRKSHPPSDGVFWLDPGWTLLPHVGAMFDNRILADIGRRLRDEEPLTRFPATPVPEGE